jgi:uncharacterized protein with PIN domain
LPDSEPIKFYLDEMVSPRVATGLRLRGIDATTAGEVGALSKSDREQLEDATGAGRVLVTMDDDYLSLHAEGVDHAGIAYVPQNRKVSIGELVHGLQFLFEVLNADEMRNHVEHL